MRFRLSTLILIVTLAAILAGVTARYYNRPSNVEMLIAHMEALPEPCTYRQFEDLAEKLSFELVQILSTDDDHYWELGDDEGSSHYVLYTEFKLVNSNGDFLLGDWKILNKEFKLRCWDGDQVWPEKSKQ